MRAKTAWHLDPDIKSRDPNNLNDHLTVAFEETFGEPDSINSHNCVWKYSFNCFNLWKVLCYQIATVFCRIPIAFCWGCYYSCVAFCHICKITPRMTSIRINCGLVRKRMELCTQTFIDPCCIRCGKIFTAFSKN